MVAINLLWKILVGFGIAGLGLASVLYGGQLKLDDDKLDKEVFDQYSKNIDGKIEKLTVSNEKDHDKLFDYVIEINGAVNEMNGNMKILMEDRGK